MFYFTVFKGMWGIFFSYNTCTHLSKKVNNLRLKVYGFFARGPLPQPLVCESPLIFSRVNLEVPSVPNLNSGEYRSSPTLKIERLSFPNARKSSFKEFLEWWTAWPHLCSEPQLEVKLEDVNTEDVCWKHWLCHLTSFSFLLPGTWKIIIV